MIDENVFFILDLMEKSGYKTRLVGGSVRDFLLQKTISDIDMATAADPFEVMNICEQHGLPVIPTGLKHGSVSILHHGKSYEITTLREDVKTFGRHAEVKFSKSFEQDSLRRDFTINAIYMDKNGKIYDYHSGVQDIFLKNIRFIGDSRKRISEDYLRILRYFRFVAAYGDYKCNEEYLQVIEELRENMSMLSSERIIFEMLKILKIPDSYRIIPSMQKVLDELFSLEFNALEIAWQLDVFESMTHAERLAMLLKFSKRGDLRTRYNLPKFITDMIALNSMDRPISSINNSVQALKQTRELYRKFYAKFLAINLYARGERTRDESKNFLEELLSFCRSEYINFPLRGKDLQKYNLSGRKLALVMRAAKNFWMNNMISPEECMKFAQKYLEEQ